MTDIPTGPLSPSEQAMATALQRATDEYAAGVEALATLIRQAHNITATARGQDLRPIVLAYARMGIALFPEGSAAHTVALHLRDMAHKDTVAEPAKQRT